MSRILTWLARIAVGGLFVAASIHKIVDPEAFARSIYNYQLVPGDFINAMAIVLPWLELVCGMALIAAPPLRRGAALWILLLLIVFTAGIASAMARGIDIACGCFSSTPVEGEHVNWFNLLRNACLIFLCGICLKRDPATQS